MKSGEDESIVLDLKIKIKIILIFLLPFFFHPVFAQEYNYEIGGSTGICFYMGDSNPGTLFRYSRPAAGAQMRYNINLRWAVCGKLIRSKVLGSTSKMASVFPEQRNVNFERTFMDFSIRSEFNFMNYSDRFLYKNSRRFAPFLFVGTGWTFSPKTEINYTGFNLSGGVGIKYKIRNRLNLLSEIAVHQLFSDKFDVTGKENELLNDPYKMKSNVLKDKDRYLVWLVSLTWDFGLRNNYCK